MNFGVCTMSASCSVTHTVTFRELVPSDRLSMMEMLQSLSEDTKSRFSPHSFDENTIISLLMHRNGSLTARGAVILGGFVSDELDDDDAPLCIQQYNRYSNRQRMACYALLYPGHDLLIHDVHRIMQYGAAVDVHNDVFIAPCVADPYQSRGVGRKMMQFVVEYCRNNLNKNRLLLWGGVQKNNVKAVSYYKRFGFKQLGEFEWHGTNIDMVCDI